MSVQVFVATNAREGLARIRRELGDDAVVLSTRPHPQGVELLASAYGDLAVPAVSEVPDAASSSRILAELSRLRGMLQNQLAGFAWGAARRRDPARVALMQTLFAAGFGSSLARTLAARLPRGLDPDAAQRWLRQVLIRNLPVQPRDADLLARGGRYALVGSTGSGKTTTLAKLAARGVDIHGAAQVALVAADAYRIGAAAQLTVYADLLGVSLHVAEDQARLALLLPATRRQETGADRHRRLCAVRPAHPGGTGARCPRRAPPRGDRRQPAGRGDRTGDGAFRPGRSRLHSHQARRNAAARRRARQPDPPSPAAGVYQRRAARAGRPPRAQRRPTSSTARSRAASLPPRMRWMPKTGRCLPASRPNVTSVAP